MTPIYTYFDDTVASPGEPQREILDLWQRSWASRGWKPVVLTPANAGFHPLYEKVTQHIRQEHRGPNPFDYEVACFHRWLALAQVGGGGGYTCDYDVMNYSLPPLPARPLKFEILARPGCCPCFVYASPIGLAWFIQRILSFTREQALNGNVSDQSLCYRLMKSGQYLGASHDICTPNCDHFPSPLIHFPHACCPHGRLQAIANYSRKI